MYFISCILYYITGLLLILYYSLFYQSSFLAATVVINACLVRSFCILIALLADEFTDTEKSLSCCEAYDKATSVPVSYGSCQCCAHTHTLVRIEATCLCYRYGIGLAIQRSRVQVFGDCIVAMGKLLTCTRVRLRLKQYNLVSAKGQ